MKNPLIRATASPDTVSDTGASVFFDLQCTEGIDNHVLGGQVFPAGSVEFDSALLPTCNFVELPQSRSVVVRCLLSKKTCFLSDRLEARKFGKTICS